jgi:transcriptional regulator with GAF, ATPase, and Fis domain
VIISQGGSLRVDLALGPCGKHLNPAAVRASVLSKQEMQRREGENILKALEQSKGKIYGPDGAAQILGMKPTTLTSRMKKMRITSSKAAGR